VFRITKYLGCSTWENDGVEKYSCEYLEAATNCIESINGKCLYLAPLVFGLLDVSRTQIRSNEPCYHRKFDQYFNQDGQCSFEDIRQVYKSFVLVADSQNDDYACQMFQTIEDVIKQTKENCLGFFQDQASLYTQLWENQHEKDSAPPIPECLKAYLPKGDEDLQEEKPEFPTVNKLIQELVLIQKLLSNKP